MPWISDSQSHWFPKDLKAGVPSLIIQFTSLPPNRQECSNKGSGFNAGNTSKILIKGYPVNQMTSFKAVWWSTVLWEFGRKSQFQLGWSDNMEKIACDLVVKDDYYSSWQWQWTGRRKGIHGRKELYEQNSERRQLAGVWRWEGLPGQSSGDSWLLTTRYMVKPVRTWVEGVGVESKEIKF